MDTASGTFTFTFAGYGVSCGRFCMNKMLQFDAAKRIVYRINLLYFKQLTTNTHCSTSPFDICTATSLSIILWKRFHTNKP